MKKIIPFLLMSALSLSACSTGAPVAGEQAAPEGEQYEADGEIKGEITVSAYDTTGYKAYLEEAAAAFESKYPETKVHIDTFSAMPEVKTSESGGRKVQVMQVEKDENAERDYINKINTELMGGEGADVLAMDIIPYYKYAEGGQLEDLKKFMDSDPAFTSEDYRMNLISATEYKGGQYIFPVDYRFNYFAYDSSLFTEEEQEVLREGEAFTYQQLIEAGEPVFNAANASNPENPIQMFGTAVPDMFRNLYQSNYSQFVDVESKTVSFDTGEFANMLKAAQEYGEKGYISKGNTGERVEITSDMFEQNVRQYFYKMKNSMGLLQEFNKNSNIRMNIAVSTNSGNEENDEIAGLISNENNEKAFDYFQAYGINANSANKSLAWEFIKFLASEELQNSLNLRGLPINNKALEEKTKMAITGQLYQPENNTGSAELTAEQTEIFDAYMEMVETMSDSLNRYFVQDEIITAAINSETRYFFDGSKTAEEVAGILQNKIELYLNE